MHDLRIKVIEIKGHCPVYKEGDEFSIVGGFMLRADKQQPLCMHSLASIMPYYVALSQGIRPAELGLGKIRHICNVLTHATTPLAGP